MNTQPSKMQTTNAAEETEEMNRKQEQKRKFHKNGRYREKLNKKVL